jgi:ERCC4-type nuclease
MMSIQVDDREDALKPFLDSQMPRRTTDVGVCRLTVSDIGVYWQVDNIKMPLMAFERKTWDDLASSIKDGRLDRQLDDLTMLKQAGASVFIVVEGKLHAQHAHIDSWNLVSKLSHIMIRFSIPVLYTKNPADTVAKVFEMSDCYPMDLISEKVAKLPPPDDTALGGAVVDPLVFRRTQNLKSDAVSVLGAVPGVSYSTSSMLLKNHTILELLTAVTAAQLSELIYPTSGNKIGIKRADDIYAELRKTDTHTRMLSQVKGITKTTAKKIISHMDADIGKWTAGDLAAVPKTAKRKLGTVVAQKIIDILVFRII